MIKTKTALKREERNTKIKSKFAEYMAIDGSMKSAVVETISRELKTSITTVNRVVKTA